MATAERNEVNEQDAPARLLAIARAFLKFATAEPARYRLMTGPRLNESGRFTGLERAIESGFELVRGEVRSGIAVGVFGPVDLTEATLTFFAAVHGLASLVIMRRIRIRRGDLSSFSDRAMGIPSAVFSISTDEMRKVCSATSRWEPTSSHAQSDSTKP